MVTLTKCGILILSQSVISELNYSDAADKLGYDKKYFHLKWSDFCVFILNDGFIDGVLFRCTQCPNPKTN